MDDEKQKPETLDEKDLYEELEPEEVYEILQEERKKTHQREKQGDKPKRPFPKWAFWIIAVFMLISALQFLPKTFSLSIIDFLQTSAKLSTMDEIDTYQESVVVVETGVSKGTGFSVSPDGYILTNHHVIDEGPHLNVGFPNAGVFEANIVKSYPEIDLALLKVDGENLPYLELAASASWKAKDHIYFIGNPLNFNGIANEGKILGRTSSSSIEGDAIMLQAPVYNGNSGSPVLTMDGQVIGIVYATTNNANYGKVGLAIPIEKFYQQKESQYIRK
ncbi:trypsin-like peptidase domain-containing protein [Virgibacillus sp. MSP4-1]|uniref:S1C family serine protease n=1 Tax=Virgibacillus sp. MSP4-1 TaxID=2700081 RepID=UPI0003A97B11|nr:serine protease [Virgibacillus sp. MSP4-1]QHS21553.1 trypsin-like peptidase domain-containing protein [Virgibacillus sp. MSP4-1]